MTMEHIDDRALIARIQQTTGLNLAALSDEIRMASMDLNTLRAKSDFLEAMRTVVRAQATERIRAELTAAGEKFTESRLSDMAHASPEYREHLQLQDRVRQDLVGAEADYYALRNRREDAIEMMRFARSEMHMG